jgi:hypothetical protein
MKKKDLPQDKSALDGYTRDVQYVKNKDGKYEAALSTGWDVKAAALDNAWDDINERMEIAKAEISKGEKSPIAYYMEEKLMDITILSGYTGFFPFTVKKHLKPKKFNSLSDKKLLKYAEAFEISLEELKNFKG